MINDNFSITTDQQIMALANNYNVWLFSLILPYLEGDVLEIGSGIGNFTKKIINLDSVKSITCYEIDQDCCNEFEQNILRGDNCSKVTFYKMDFNKSNLTRQFDFIFSFNVLEHIEDDQKTMHLISEYLKPAANLVLYLPAMNCLYGSIDRELGHYRRYNKNMIKELFRPETIKLEKLKYFNTIGALGWFYTNRVLKKNAQSPEMVVFYDKYVFPPLSYIERLLPTYFGANLFVKAKAERKNDNK